MDGARRQPERDIAPGEAMPVALDIELPPEDGRYQVLISPMREGVCWYYERGWRFLLVEATTENEASRLLRVASTSPSSRLPDK